MVTTLRNPRVVALVILAVFAWLSWAGQASRPTAHILSLGEPSQQMSGAPRAPDRIGLWSGRVLAVDHRAVEILETDDVALMEYRLGEEPPVWFAQVAGFGNRAAFHPPELCYVGSHYEVLERQPVTVMVWGEPHRLMRLVIGQAGKRFEAWYWFTANERVTPSYYEQQFWLVMDAIRHKPSSGTLVRISTPVEDPNASHRRLLAFVTAFETLKRTPTVRVARYGL